MYAGHVGIALALRADRDAPPLWLLVLAAQGPDWGDALHELLRRPYGDPGWSSHALPVVALGSLGAALVALAITRGRARAALLACVAYASHWAADYFTGYKPTWSGGPLVGLGWYDHPVLDLALETWVIAVGWWLWRRSLPRERRRAPLAWALLAALVSLQLTADVVMSNYAALSFK